MQVFIDGDFFPKEEAKISVFDHGFLYGDGIFEGLRVYYGRIFRAQEHLDRLLASAKAISLNLPYSLEEINKLMELCCLKNGIQEGYIRLIVSRGKGKLGLDPKSCPKASLIIIADKIQLYPEEDYQMGLKLITSSYRRHAQDCLSPMIKSLNYLNNILARMEAGRLGYREALMLNKEGKVAECTGDNIFIIKTGKLLTPALTEGILAGITRQAVIEIAHGLNLEVEEKSLLQYELYQAEECFLSGTAAEIMPVIEIDGRSIGQGTAGSQTRKILSAFRELVKKECQRLNSA